MNDKLNNFYNNNQDELEREWELYIYDREWGSGEDKITITEGMFWEWVEEEMEDAEAGIGGYL